MTPGFTAEAALSAEAPAYAGGVRARAHGKNIVPQQRRDPNDVLSVTGGVLQCPGCSTHRCGFLGLSTCLTCC